MYTPKQLVDHIVSLDDEALVYYVETVNAARRLGADATLCDTAERIIAQELYARSAKRAEDAGQRRLAL